MLPKQGSEGAAGYDLNVACDCIIPSQSKGIVQMNVLPSTYAKIASRSGLVIKKFIDEGRSVVDGDYQAELAIYYLITP